MLGWNAAHTVSILKAFLIVFSAGLVGSSIFQADFLMILADAVFTGIVGAMSKLIIVLDRLTKGGKSSVT